MDGLGSVVHCQTSNGMTLPVPILHSLLKVKHTGCPFAFSGMLIHSSHRNIVGPEERMSHKVTCRLRVRNSCSTAAVKIRLLVLHVSVLFSLFTLLYINI